MSKLDHAICSCLMARTRTAWLLAGCLTLGLVAAAPQAVVAAGLNSSSLVLGILNTTGVCDGAQTISNSGTDNSPAVSCSGPTWSETASASSAFGTLRALADLRFKGFTFAPDTNQAFFQAKAEADFSDTLTFSKGVFWEFTVGVSGQSVFVNSSGIADNRNVGWCFNMFAAGCGISPYGITDFGPHTFLYRIPANGIVDVSARLTIDLSANFFSAPSGPITRDSYADLSHTVQFVSSRVLDANNQPIADALITSASGFDYSKVHAVPEPSSIASMALGLVGLLLVTRRTR